MPFRVGDTVQLRYGSSTPMRVEKVDIRGGNEWITCVWGVNNECRNYFVADTLQSAGRHQPHSPRRPGLWDRLASWFRS